MAKVIKLRRKKRKPVHQARLKFRADFTSIFEDLKVLEQMENQINDVKKNPNHD